MHKLGWAAVACICVAGTALSQDWLQKPFTEWSAGQIDRILNDSPWVGICVARQKRGEFEALQAVGVLPSPLCWRVRLLTARPVREALLAELSFAANAGGDSATVNVQDVRDVNSPARREARLKEWAKSYPEDFRIKGDDENIVIALTMTQFVQSWVAAQYEIDRHSRSGSERNPTVVGEDTRRMPSDWKEDPRPEKLMNLKTSDLAGRTYLSTKSGRRVGVLRYEPPGNDRLGARLYFSRKLADGTPLLTEADKEIQFETMIDAQSVKVTFSVKKLVYKGKLEI
jgi:hypothetical protein